MAQASGIGRSSLGAADCEKLDCSPLNGGAFIIQPFLAPFRILIVEDDDFVAIIHEDFVEQYGCASCVRRRSVAETLGSLDIYRPHLVLLDIALKRTTPDFQIADALTLRGMPFIFCSALSRKVIPERHQTRPFVSKPFYDWVMVGAMHAALGLAMPA